MSFLFFVMNIWRHVINRKKTQCLSPRNKGRGKGRKNGTGFSCPYTRRLIVCNLVSSVRNRSDEGQASHMRNQCFITREVFGALTPLMNNINFRWLDCSKHVKHDTLFAGSQVIRLCFSNLKPELKGWIRCMVAGFYHLLRLSSCPS